MTTTTKSVKRPREFDRIAALAVEVTQARTGLEAIAGRLRLVCVADQGGALTDSEHREVLMAATLLAQMAELLATTVRDLDLVQIGTHRQVPVTLLDRYAVPPRCGL